MLTLSYSEFCVQKIDGSKIEILFGIYGIMKKIYFRGVQRESRDIGLI